MKAKHGAERGRYESRVTDLEETAKRNEAMYKSTLANLQANLDLDKTQYTQNVAALKSELRYV